MSVSCSTYIGKTQKEEVPMATKKKTSKKTAKKKTAKKVAKKTAAKKAPRKRNPNRKKRVLPTYEPDEARIERFMHTLINAGYMGDELGADGKERKRQAGGCRQMAVVLDRQFRVFHATHVERDA